MGRVTVTIIWSMGLTPLSTAISTRGKFVFGNTDTGMVKARYPPSSARVRMRKIIGREWRATQCSDFLRDTQSLRGGDFSLEGSFGASFEFSVGACAMILVLLGRP